MNVADQTEAISIKIEKCRNLENLHYWTIMIINLNGFMLVKVVMMIIINILFFIKASHFCIILIWKTQMMHSNLISTSTEVGSLCGPPAKFDLKDWKN